MIIVDKVENGPVLICPNIHKDDRGYFYESFNDAEFREKVCNTTFVQDNQSCSSYGVLRGMHFQKEEYAQAKLVRVVKGAVLDVVLDIRSNSPNYGKFYDYLLTEENHYQLFVPRGFAHGFLCLKDNTIFQYKCDNPYNKKSEGSVRYDSFGFDWTKFINADDIIVSEKDKVAIPFDTEGKGDIVELSKGFILNEMENSPKLKYEIGPVVFKEDIYADVINSKGIASRAKLKYITSPILGFGPKESSRRIVCEYDNGHEFGLSQDFDEVIRFYIYKNK